MNEANALLPRLSALLASQFERLAGIEASVARLREKCGEAAPPLHPDPNDAPDVALVKTRLRELIRAFREGWDEIERTGAVVKDPRIGLLDFYGEHEGQRVWLCWRYGEPSVSHWHPLDQGFASRRPLPLEYGEIPRTLN